MKQLLTKISYCTATAVVVLAAALATQVDTASASASAPQGTGAFMLPSFVLDKQTNLRSLDEAVTAGRLDARVVDALHADGNVDAIVTFEQRSRAKNTFGELSEKQAIDEAGDGADLVSAYRYLPVSLVRFTSDQALLDMVNADGVTGVRFNDTLVASGTSNLPLIRQPQAAARGFTGNGTYVAVLDTGVDYTNAAFGCSAPSVPATCRVSHSYEFAAEDGQLDDDGHGTNVAGIVASVAPGARIIAMDVFKSNRSSTNDQIAAINKLFALKAGGVNVVALNMSMGVSETYFESTCPSHPLTPVFATSRQWGILPVVSAGNSAIGDKYDKPFRRGIESPACVPGAISVGATTTAPGFPRELPIAKCKAARADVPACFSNSGNLLTLLAPGVNVTAAGTTHSGTSQAAPHVAGAVAVLAQAKYGAGQYRAAEAQLIQNALAGSGPSIYDKRSGITRRRLDVMAAVDTLLAGTGTPAPPVPSTGLAKPGRYVGTTSQNEPISFEVSSDGRTITNLRFSRNASCQPAGGISLYGSWWMPNTTIGSDSRFSSVWSGGTSAGGNANSRIDGRVDSLGNASGSFTVNQTHPYNGTTYQCTSGNVVWTARLS